MSTENHTRTPAGVPAGGEFATTARAENAVGLTAPAAGPRVVATVQRQQWDGDNALSLGGPLQIDVTDLVAAMTPAERSELADNDSGSDDLYRAAMDAGLTPAHDGPFEVRVEDSLAAYRAAGAEADLEAVYAQLIAANKTMGIATAHLVAAKILAVCPEAAYVELGSSLEEYGARVRSGAVLAADGTLIALDLSHLGDEDAGEGNMLWEDADELLHAVGGVENLQHSPAMLEPVDTNPDGTPRTFRYRLDLRAAVTDR